MSLEYYIHCRNHCTQLIHNIDKELYITNIMHISKKRNYFIELKQKYENKIKYFCKQEFVKDFINKNPDRSMTSEYCKICEYTKKNGS